MAVYNLGSYGQPRPSMLNGLGDALMTGLQVGEKIRSNKAGEDLGNRELAEKIRSNKADEETAATLAKTKALNDRTYAEAVDNQKANLDFKKAESNRAYSYKTLENYSRIMNDKSPAEREALMNSDHGKEINNLVKTYIPEYYDKDKKQIMLLTDKNMNKEAVEAKINKATSAIAAGTGTPEDIQLVKLHSRNPELISDALTYAQNESRKTNDKSKPNLLNLTKKFIDNYLGKSQQNVQSNMLTNELGAPPQAQPQEAQNPMADALAPAQNAGPGSDPNIDEDDPLGILKR